MGGSFTRVASIVTYKTVPFSVVNPLFNLEETQTQPVEKRARETAGGHTAPPDSSSSFISKDTTKLLLNSNHCPTLIV
jgi:hypothetical protein